MIATLKWCGYVILTVLALIVTAVGGILAFLVTSAFAAGYFILFWIGFFSYVIKEMFEGSSSKKK